MKYKKLIPRAAGVLLGVILIAFGILGVFAAPDDDSSVSDDPQIVTDAPQPQPDTEAPQPVTEEPQPEPQPETEAPQPVTEEPQPETEYVEYVTEYVDPDPYYYANNVDDPDTGATKYIAEPTVPKTVSQKAYSTNYAFGAASWICAGVGIVVILAVAISTKASGRKNRVMYDRFPNR